MNNEQLSKSFVESEGWEWLDGMQNEEGDRYNGEFDSFWYGPDYVLPSRSDTPDLNDPATLRLILELIRRREGWRLAFVQEFNSGIWVVSVFCHKDGQAEHRRFRGETEQLALWAAWEASMK